MSSSVTSFASSPLSTALSVMMRIRLARTVSAHSLFLFPIFAKVSLGGQIGHRKYDCPEQRNFTANIICRVCGNAGHMARDCPDRQRGANWRNDAPGPMPGRAPAGRIGGGDAVDREYEVRSNNILQKHQLKRNSNSCKSFLVMVQPMARLPNVLKLALAGTTTGMQMGIATSNPGNVDRPAKLLHGPAVEMTLAVVMTMVLAMVALRLLGPLDAVQIATAMDSKVAATVLQAELLRGNDSKTRHHLPRAGNRAMAMAVILVTGTRMATVLRLAWELLQASEAALVGWALHLGSAHSSRITDPTALAAPRLLHLLATLHLLRLPAISHHRLLQVLKAF